ncbi:MAG TPA: hypothetical protein VEJ63_11350 [Planctomycetota bacterium]|nr:hypothetical protein [Planctomycetota bacterium]
MRSILFSAVLGFASCLWAASGDPQVKTDHPWYPGELSCSTFERLFKTQTELYKRVTGKDTSTDEDKALAAFYWRNLNYFHGEEGKSNYFGKGLNEGSWTRDYWLGLFGHGYGLCGTTHAQWCAEMEYLLGHGRGRVTGVEGHNSFEVYLTGGAYGKGQWVLLDHDVSTVIFHEDGSRLLSIPEIKEKLATYKNPNFKPERQRGWRVGGLHDSDPAAYAQYNSAEYFSGYAGPTPIVHLRAGESLRRYLKPGLEDGKTFAYWGMNYMTEGIPGPERSLTWVNQPEKMYNSKTASPYKPGQARFANAVYTYKPDFASGSYKEGVISEDDKQVTFEFYTPYVIASTPASHNKGWPIYEPGGKNGLVISGKAGVAVQISVDQGKTWKDAGTLSERLDATDLVKGYQQYWLKINAPAKTLAGSGLTITTVCQTNGCLIPHLKDGGTKVTFAASGQGQISAGPTKEQAAAHVVEGAMDSKTVTLEVATPRKEKATRLFAAAHVASGNPPNPDVKFQVEYSTDGGKTWAPVVKDWQIPRRPQEPADFWSQSNIFGTVELKDVTGPVRVRFSNDAGRGYMKAEAHLFYAVQKQGPTTVTFAWKEDGGALKTASHTYPSGKEDSAWSIPTGNKVETVWVEYSSK